MGLDYSIELQIKNKETKDISTAEIAYWRKCYALRDTIHNLARQDCISEDEDFEVICNTSILNEVINCLSELLPNREASEWTDSIWTAIDVRISTSKILTKLIAVDNYLSKLNSSEEGIKDAVEFIEDIIFAKDDCYGSIDKELLLEVSKNLDNYEITIAFYNSY